MIGWFLGLQNARVPLLIMVTTNVTNIILDLVFVVGLGMTVDGVAFASVIAEYTGTALGVLLVVRNLRVHPGRWLRERVLDRVSFARMVSVNRNIFIRTLCLVFAFAFFTSQSAAQGDLILAANAVLMNLQHFTSYALDGFAHAAEALVGRYVGARDRRGFLRAVKVAAQWSVGVAAVFSGIYLVAGSFIIDVITDIDTVRATARAYLPWMVLSPLISVWSFLLDGVFIGATRGREMRNTMLVSMLLIYLPAWYLLQPLGNHGLWMALMVFMAARALTMGWSWRRMLRTDAFGVGTGAAASS
jgi:MATE family multidrug resistance protein